MNASSLNLGGGPPSSSLDLSNNKAKTSSLDLGGGNTNANATNTRSTRRNKGDEPMAVDEEESEGE